MGLAELGFVSYICPICGRVGISKEDPPACEFCKSISTIVLPGKVIYEIRERVKDLSPLEYRENLVLTQRDLYELEATTNDLSKQKTIKNNAVYTELLYKRYLYNNPLFDKAKFDMRNEWEYERAVEYEARCAESRKRQEEASRPRCPKCGCTEFQMVPRKWSPLTGFLTNKVDRVCVKCKTRF